MHFAQLLRCYCFHLRKSRHCFRLLLSSLFSSFRSPPKREMNFQITERSISHYVTISRSALSVQSMSNSLSIPSQSIIQCRSRRGCRSCRSSRSCRSRCRSRSRCCCCSSSPNKQICRKLVRRF